MPILRVAIPPTLPLSRLQAVADAFRRVFGPPLCVDVDVTISQGYEALARNLLSGAVDLAWAPPFVCALTEPEGAVVLAQAVRGGRTEYASALVVTTFSADVLADLRGARASFVEPDSVAGHLLPLAHIRASVPGAATLFSSTTFAGSYRAALEDVLAGRADVTAVHALTDDEDSFRRAIDVHIGTGANAPFRAVAFTPSTPSEALVSSPHSPFGVDALRKAAVNMHLTTPGKSLLANLFLAEGFRAAEAGAYKTLHRLLPRR